MEIPLNGTTERKVTFFFYFSDKKNDESCYYRGENKGQGECKNWEGLGQEGARGVSKCSEQVWGL
jgi:hypothetical protein